MTEQIRKYYFLIVRLILILAVEIYILINNNLLAEPSPEVFLLLALYMGTAALSSLYNRKMNGIMLIIMFVMLILNISIGGVECILLGVLLYYDVISYFRCGLFWYVISLVIACVPTNNNIFISLITAIFTGLLYFQHDYIIESYSNQIETDLRLEQNLKKRMSMQEEVLKDQLKRGLLTAENQSLEEKAMLSQRLHDKLGHSINGSIYQLEAVKIIMDTKPENAKQMIQAVIDQLRTGMDEIREILRSERPEKYKLALTHLNKLCDECIAAGVEAELDIQGNPSDIPDKYLEIILDNTYEGVTNALKYANCTKIHIKIYVMNKLIRCVISDNGRGCKEINDGMGIAGMRRRVRDVGGVLDFKTEAGFTINMLLPIR